jgi:hypothetical protein
VQCYDIPSAFVNTDVGKDVLMVLKEDLAEMMVQIAPEIYRKYVTLDKKRTKFLYVKLQKALYSLMRASLLFYCKLRKEFEEYKLKVNPYDLCVANMITKSGKQLIVVWYINDLMGLCEGDFKLTKFLCYLGSTYGTKLSMHTGKKYNYLGMDMEFNNKGTLDVSMITYSKNVIEQFPEVINRNATRPAAEHLFMVRDKKETKTLEEDQVLAFHNTIAELLFMCTRAQQDIQTAVAFLTTRVKNPDKDDWGKLKRVLKYLNGTKYLKLKLTAEHGQPCNAQMVRQRVSQHPCRLQRAQGRTFYHGKMSNLQLLKKAQVEHSEFDRKQVGHGGYVYARNAVVTTLHTGTRIQGKVYRFISR